MSEILIINDLWGGYKADVDILRGVSMKVMQGEAVGIIGLNGSGKSTLGKAIMNMIPYRKGEIIFEDNDVFGLTTCQLSHCGISIMQQGGKVFQTLSAWDNLLLAMSKHSAKTLETLRGIIPMLQVPKKELQRMMSDKLSGGQKHQLSLAMTLATNPRLVILDEPSAGLSPKAVDETYEILQAVRNQLGLSIILIEQNIARAINFCSRCLVLAHGQVIQKDHCEFKDIESLMYNHKIIDHEE